MLASKRTHCRSSTFNVLPRRPVLLLRMPAWCQEMHVICSFWPSHQTWQLRVVQLQNRRTSVVSFEEAPQIIHGRLELCSRTSRRCGVSWARGIGECSLYTCAAAARALSSYTGSPVSLDSRPNSSSRVPAHAVQVTRVS